MPSYLQIKNQILKLQNRAEILRVRERTEVIAKIKEAIVAYELTSKDLGWSITSSGNRARRSIKRTKSIEAATVTKRSSQPPKLAAAKSKSRKEGRKAAGIDKRSVVAPKYRDSATGTTWTGRGKQPKWLAAAIKSGKKLEDFKI